MVRFWDTSAILQLFIKQAHSESLLELRAKADSECFVWWGTYIECISGINRLQREKIISKQNGEKVLQELKIDQGSWYEIPPSESIREKARKLLRLHPLKAADAFQLAAALTIAEDIPEEIEFVCLDAKLVEAASLEDLVITEIENPTAS